MAVKIKPRIHDANTKINVSVHEYPKVEPDMLKKDYETLKNKPKINGVELIGDKSFDQFGQPRMTNEEIKEIIDKAFAEVFGG